MSLIDYLCIFFIFSVGLPHGALDGALAIILGFNNRKGYYLFSCFYLISIIAVVVFWYFFPKLALGLFIIGSIFHFGACDWLNYGKKENKILVVLTHGFVVLFGIVFFNQEESYSIFKSLSGRDLIYHSRLMNALYSISLYLLVVYFLKSILFDRHHLQKVKVLMVPLF